MPRLPALLLMLSLVGCCSSTPTPTSAQDPLVVTISASHQVAVADSVVSLEQLTDFARQHAVTRAIIRSAPGTLKNAGDGVVQALKAAGVQSIVFDVPPQVGHTVEHTGADTAE